MFWKIATIILIVTCLWLYGNSIKIERELLATRTQLNSAQTQNDELKEIRSNLQSLQEKLKQSEERKNQLARKVGIITQKYPINIKSILFLNVNEGDTLLSSGAVSSANRSDLDYLVPLITFSSNLERDTSITIFYEILDPDERPLMFIGNSRIRCEVEIKGDRSTDFEQTLSKYNVNNSSVEEMPIGNYKVNIWYNNAVIYRGSFQIM